MKSTITFCKINIFIGLEIVYSSNLSLRFSCLVTCCWLSWSFWKGKDDWNFGISLPLAKLKMRRYETCWKVPHLPISQATKQNNGLSTPLAVSKCRRQDVNMDFVLGLSKICRQYDSILVVMDRFSKMAQFIPCAKTIGTYRVATIFVQGIVKLHGLPKTIVSDMNVKFTSYYFRKISGINQTLSFNSLLCFIPKLMAKLK